MKLIGFLLSQESNRLKEDRISRQKILNENRILNNLKKKHKISEKFFLKIRLILRFFNKIVESIYKISLTLQNSNSQHQLNKIVESIYKISLTLQNSNSQHQLNKIVESIYKISLTLQNSNSQHQLNKIVECLRRVLKAKHFPENKNKIINNIERLTSFGQLESKIWLIKTLKEKNLLNLGTVFVCAGWYALLPFFLLKDKDFLIKQIFNFDIDPLSVLTSEDLNRESVKNNWKFKAVLKDILDLNYQIAQFNTLKANGELQNLSISPDTIINTACEHISNFSCWWKLLPTGKLIILQSNNFFESEDHSNCVKSLKEFKKQAPLSLIYEGELHLEKYTRFMLIGYKK